MNQEKYNEEKIPDLIELKKELSEANKLRHKFWKQLRAVRNQTLKYLSYHRISPEEFNKRIKNLSQKEKIFLTTEYKKGRKIPPKELEDMRNRVDLLWTISLTTSQLKEEETRKSIKRGYAHFLNSPWDEDHVITRETIKKGHVYHKFFRSEACLNCGLPLEGKQIKFCSHTCNEQYQKRKSKAKQSKRQKEMRPAQMRPNPQKGNGKQNPLCEHYSSCEEETEIWKRFNCETCPLYLEGIYR